MAHRFAITLLTTCFTLLTSISAFADRIYTVTLPAAGGVTVSGTITTNGNLGVLSIADLVDFDLVVSSPSLSITNELLGPAHGPWANPSSIRFEGVLASETTLFLQPLSQPPGLIAIESLQPCGWTRVIVTPVPPGTYAEHLEVCTAVASDVGEIGLPMSGVELARGGVAIPHRVTIDIKPDTFPNVINPKSNKVIAVVILTTPTFNATTVDQSSVQFGPNRAIPVFVALEDVDGDGRLDMSLRFKTQATGISCGDIVASLTGQTTGGRAIDGVDSIETQGCK